MCFRFSAMFCIAESLLYIVSYVFILKDRVIVFYDRCLTCYMLRNLMVFEYLKSK